MSIKIIQASSHILDILEMLSGPFRHGDIDMLHGWMRWCASPCHPGLRQKRYLRAAKEKCNEPRNRTIAGLG